MGNGGGSLCNERDGERDDCDTWGKGDAQRIIAIGKGAHRVDEFFCGSLQAVCELAEL